MNMVIVLYSRCILNNIIFEQATGDVYTEHWICEHICARVARATAHLPFLAELPQMLFSECLCQRSTFEFWNILDLLKLKRPNKFPFRVREILSSAAVVVSPYNVQQYSYRLSPAPEYKETRAQPRYDGVSSPSDRKWLAVGGHRCRGAFERQIGCLILFLSTRQNNHIPLVWWLPMLHIWEASRLTIWKNKQKNCTTNTCLLVVLFKRTLNSIFIGRHLWITIGKPWLMYGTK